MKKKTSRFKGRLNAGVKRTKKDSSSFGYINPLPKGMKIYVPDPGKSEKFDILPYIVTNEKHPNKKEMLDDIWWNAPFKVHRGVGTNTETIICPTSFGKPCPICEYFTKRKKEGADWDELKILKPSLRALYAVVPIDNKKFEETIHVFDMSNFLFYDLLTDETKEDEDYECFPESLYSECMDSKDIEWLIEYSQLTDDEREIITEFSDCTGYDLTDYEPKEILDFVVFRADPDDNDTIETQYAYETAENCDRIPEWLQSYFDYESYGKDICEGLEVGENYIFNIN